MKTIVSKTILLLLISIPMFLIGQTGPGGVGNSSNNELWLIADSNIYTDDGNTTAIQNSKIQQWNDLSGNGNNALQLEQKHKPRLKEEKLNHHNTLFFNGKNNRILSQGLSTNGNLTVFVVFKHGKDSTGTEGIIHAAPSGMAFSTNENSKSVGIWTNTSTGAVSGRAIQANGAIKDLPETRTINRGKFYIVTQDYTGTEVNQYINGLMAGSISYNGTLTNWTDFGIGRQGNESLRGNIAEVIVYKSSLNEAQIIIINNYLAAKYGLKLENHNYYSQDSRRNGNFDFNVAGIGYATDGSSNLTAKGTGIIQISNPSQSPNDAFLIWGENRKNATYHFNTTSTYSERVNTTWRVSKRNNLGTVSVSINETDLNLPTLNSCQELKLIISSQSDFSNPVFYSLTLINGVYQVDNVNFNDGDFFSIQYQDIIALDQSGFKNGTGTNQSPSTSDGCYKLLVKSTANSSIKLKQNAIIREIHIEAGGVLTIDQGVYLQVANTIVNNGTLIIEENGSLIQMGAGLNTNSGSGTYIVKRTGNNSPFVYNIWSTPVTSPKLVDIFTNANPCDLWVFDENNQAWTHDFSVGYTTTCYGNPVTFTASDVIAGGNGKMDVGRGYFVPGSSSATKSFQGEVNNGDYTQSITTTEIGNPGGDGWGDDDWNLIGNPYPSGLDATAFWNENAVENNRITGALYFWDEADTSGGYNQHSDYASWNLLGGVNSGNSSKIPNGHIASGQGFWVIASTNTDVVFNNAMRSSNNSQFYKVEEPVTNHAVWVSLSSPSNYQNNILVGYNKNTTDGYNPAYDAHKLPGNAHVRMASLIGNEEFVIQSIAALNIGETKTIPLVVFSDESGIHSISEYQRENLPSGFIVYLRDNYLGIEHDLANGDYSVELEINKEYKDRFELIFENTISITDGDDSDKGGTGDADSTVTGIDDISNKEYYLFQDENEIVITNENGINGDIYIHNISGQLMWSKENVQNSNRQTINWSHFKSGNYVISIMNNGNREYIKQVIKP